MSLDQSIRLCPFQWHVVWVTQLAWPPTDERGDWQSLADLYATLAASGASVVLSAPLPTRWQRRPLRDDAITLSTVAQEYLLADLNRLASADRIAGGTQIGAAAVSPVSVQLLVSCPQETFLQRIARLKSRSATLLSFRAELGVGGAGTWGRGVWWARTDDQKAIESIKSFLAGPKVAAQAPCRDGEGYSQEKKLGGEGTRPS